MSIGYEWGVYVPVPNRNHYDSLRFDEFEEGLLMFWIESHFSP